MVILIIHVYDNFTMVNNRNKGRNFLLTINERSLEFYQDIITYLTGLSQFQYLLCTEHIGSSNKHYHVYVQYNNTKKLTPVYLHGAHFDPCYGSAQQNINYCWARDAKHQSEGVTAILIDEIGEPKKKGGAWSVGVLKDMEEPDELPATYYNIFQKIKNKRKSDEAFYEMLEMVEKDSLRPVEVVYFIGKPGCGKTYNAYKYALSRYQKNEITKVTIQNNFFEFVGSDKDKCLVIEEFRPSQLHPSSLLQFTDKYGYSCPIKGGYKYVKPEMIIISSIIHPARLYREEKDELNEQFTRRISHLFEVTSNHSYFEVSLTTSEFYYCNNVINSYINTENLNNSTISINDDNEHVVLN